MLPDVCPVDESDSQPPSRISAPIDPHRDRRRRLGPCERRGDDHLDGHTARHGSPARRTSRRRFANVETVAALRCAGWPVTSTVDAKLAAAPGPRYPIEVVTGA